MWLNASTVVERRGIGLKSKRQQPDRTDRLEPRRRSPTPTPTTRSIGGRARPTAAIRSPSSTTRSTARAEQATVGPSRDCLNRVRCFHGRRSPWPQANVGGACPACLDGPLSRGPGQWHRWPDRRPLPPVAGHRRLAW